MKNDEQLLESLLRDVPVPEGLHERLLAIAEPQVTREPALVFPGRRSQVSWWTMLLATAAALGAIAFWIAWPPRDETISVAQGENKNKNKNQNESPPVTAGVDVELLRANRERLEALEARIQLLNSGRRLRAMEKRLMTTSSRSAVPSLSAIDRQSLTRFAANEAALAWGASVESVRNEMEALIEHFPGSRGADRAAKYLATNSTPSSIEFQKE